MEFVYHKINLIISRLFYFFVAEKKVSSDKEKKNIKKNRFYISNNESRMNNDIELVNVLKLICNHTKNYKNTNLFQKYVLKGNYTFFQHSLSNQKHCDELPSELILKLSQCLENSDIITLAESFMQCKFSVVNVRSWIFYPEKTKNDGPVNKHFDGLRKGTLKIMFYEGSFDQQPALTIYENDKEYDVLGENPLVLFEPNTLLHGALAPKINSRPTVELTLSPRFSNKCIIQQAGFQAGLPTNPLKEYTKNCGMLHS